MSTHNDHAHGSDTHCPHPAKVQYSRMGARFAKWRAVITPGDSIPSRGCIESNAHALARYAALCQEAGLVPVVEPEVLMDGELRSPETPPRLPSRWPLFCRG